MAVGLRQTDINIFLVRDYTIRYDGVSNSCYRGSVYMCCTRVAPLAERVCTAFRKNYNGIYSGRIRHDSRAMGRHFWCTVTVAAVL